MAQRKFTMENIRLTQANRDLKRGQVDRLKKLIEKNGYCNSMPIIVDEDGLIMDGQHRYVACKELGIEPPIVVEKNFDIVPVLNSTQLSWTLRDFVKFYAEKGYEDYVILQNICKEKNLSPMVVHAIITGKSSARTGMSHYTAKMNVLKTGTFKLPSTDAKALVKLDRKINLIIGIITQLGLPRTERLVLAITRLSQDPNFVFSTMENKIQYQRARIYRCTTIAEYEQMLANIYNNKNMRKVAV